MELLKHSDTLAERGVTVDRPKSLSLDALNRGAPPRDGGFSRWARSLSWLASMSATNPCKPC